MTTTISARDFNRDVSAAKRAADAGPVVVTDRGEPAYVLLSIEAFRQLKGRRSIVDALTMPDGDDIEVEFDRTDSMLDPSRVPDL